MQKMDAETPLQDSEEAGKDSRTVRFDRWCADYDPFKRSNWDPCQMCTSPESITASGSHSDYVATFIATVFLGIFGALGTFFCCNTYRGRAGAASGLIVRDIVMILLCSLGYWGCYLQSAQTPVRVAGLKYTWDITAADCSTAGGQWHEQSPYGTWCSGACPKGYVHRRSNKTIDTLYSVSRAEYAEYCVDVAKVGKAEPVPQTLNAGDYEGWWVHLARWWSDRLRSNMLVTVLCVLQASVSLVLCLVWRDYYLRQAIADKAQPWVLVSDSNAFPDNEAPLPQERRETTV